MNWQGCLIVNTARILGLCLIGPNRSNRSWQPSHFLTVFVERTEPMVWPLTLERVSRQLLFPKRRWKTTNIVADKTAVCGANAYKNGKNGVLGEKSWLVSALTSCVYVGVCLKAYNSEGQSYRCSWWCAPMTRYGDRRL